MSFFPLTELGVLRKTGDSDPGEGRGLGSLAIPDSTDSMEDYMAAIRGQGRSSHWPKI